MVQPMHTITATSSTPDSLVIDYIGIAYHDLSGVTITVSIDGTPLLSHVVVDNSPFIIPLVDEFADPITCTSIELFFDTAADIEIAVLNIGLLLTTQRPVQWVGQTPLVTAGKHEINPVKAINGQFLGGRVIKKGVETQFTIENLKPDWVRSFFKPFIVHALTKPYFIAPKYDAYPNEVGYGWTNEDIRVSNQRPNGMMDTSFTFEGVADETN